MESVQVKINPFSGEKKDWERWSTTFLAKARLRDYRNVILGVEIPPQGIKRFKSYVLRNDIAYAKILIGNRWVFVQKGTELKEQD
jgi:hypothetical protein